MCNVSPVPSLLISLWEQANSFFVQLCHAVCVSVCVCVFVLAVYYKAQAQRILNVNSNKIDMMLTVLHNVITTCHRVIIRCTLKLEAVRSVLKKP